MSVVIPVLLYHSVSDDPPPSASWGAVSRGDFAAHVDAILASGRQAVTITRLAAALRGDDPLPDRVVAVTFDDGYDDTYPAVETLCAHGLAPTVYLTTGEIGARHRLTAREVASLADMPGVEIASHGVHHRRLDELSVDEVLGELRPSKWRLEDLIGDYVDSFAYPYGAYDHRVQEALISCDYRSGAAVKNALCHEADDPFAIARVTVTGTTSWRWVADVLEGRGVPLAWRAERLRTRAYRTVRRQRRRMRAVGALRC